MASDGSLLLVRKLDEGLGLGGLIGQTHVTRTYRDQPEANETSVLAFGGICSSDVVASGGSHDRRNVLGFAKLSVNESLGDHL